MQQVFRLLHRFNSDWRFMSKIVNRLKMKRPILVTMAIPWSGWDQAIFTIIMMACLAIFVNWIAPELTLSLIVGAWGGVIGNALITAPAEIELDIHEKVAAIDKLVASKYVFEESDNSWTAPLPSWLRWNYAKIDFREIGDLRFIMSGPRIMIRQLIPLSKNRFFGPQLW